jgi:hypothetical protein
MTETPPHRSSFRDPSGFVYERDGLLLRQVASSYKPTYDKLIGSGLLQHLQEAGLLVTFREAAPDLAATEGAVAVLQSERIPFISYPYEWCFGQLKDAALLTLRVMDEALGRGMILKDASAYNVQFVGAQPQLIDQLSFDVYEEGKPWIAYGQFCRHFLAPLALMAYTDVRLSSLLRSYIDGIPLDLAAKLLPGSTKLKPGLLTHLHLHAQATVRSDSATPAKQGKFSHTALKALVESLRSTIQRLDWSPAGTVWGDYYSNTNYTDDAMAAKHSIVREMLALATPATTCWDLGANTGEFSRIAVERGLRTIALDMDPAAVELGYRWAKGTQQALFLPLLQDFSNPSPALGWAGVERDSLEQRGPADVLLGLALIHHLAIGNNVPLPKVADWMAGLGTWLIIEWVPKEDSQVQRMLSQREDVFSGYDRECFESGFRRRFEIVRREEVPGTARTMFLMRRLG